MRTPIISFLFLLFSLGVAKSQTEWEALNQEIQSRLENSHRPGGIWTTVDLAKKALEVAEKNDGPDHLNEATSLNNLALLYIQMGRNGMYYTEAEPLLKRALKIREKALGPDHPEVATILNSLGRFYEGLGQDAQAERFYKRAIPIVEKQKMEELQKALQDAETDFGPVHPKVAAAQVKLAEFYRAHGESAKAEQLLEWSQTILAIVQIKEMAARDTAEMKQEAARALQAQQEAERRDQQAQAQREAERQAQAAQARQEAQAKVEAQKRSLEIKNCSPADVSSWEIACEKYQPSRSTGEFLSGVDGVFVIAYLAVAQRLSPGEFLVSFPTDPPRYYHCTIPSYIKLNNLVTGRAFKAIIRTGGIYEYVTAAGYKNSVQSINALYAESLP